MLVTHQTLLEYEKKTSETFSEYCRNTKGLAQLLPSSFPAQVIAINNIEFFFALLVRI